MLCGVLWVAVCPHCTLLMCISCWQRATQGGWIVLSGKAFYEAQLLYLQKKMNQKKQKRIWYNKWVFVISQLTLLINSVLKFFFLLSLICCTFHRHGWCFSKSINSKSQSAMWSDGTLFTQFLSLAATLKYLYHMEGGCCDWLLCMHSTY